MSRDVVFDESTSWYAPELTTPQPSMNDLDNTEEDDKLRSKLDKSLITTKLSEPQQPPSDQSTSRPSLKMDKGNAKLLEYEDDKSNDNESTHSLYNEFGAFDVALMRIAGVHKAIARTNEKLRRSTSMHQLWQDHFLGNHLTSL